jgi:hypothetical protein
LNKVLEMVSLGLQIRVTMTGTLFALEAGDTAS